MLQTNRILYCKRKTFIKYLFDFWWFWSVNFTSRFNSKTQAIITWCIVFLRNNCVSISCTTQITLCILLHSQRSETRQGDGVTVVSARVQVCVGVWENMLCFLWHLSRMSSDVYLPRILANVQYFFIITVLQCLKSGKTNIYLRRNVQRRTIYTKLLIKASPLGQRQVKATVQQRHPVVTTDIHLLQIQNLHLNSRMKIVK